MKKTVFIATTVLFFSVILRLFLGYAEHSALLKRVSFALDDVLFKTRYASEPLPASRAKLLVVSIDDESSFRLGLRWPWPRATFAAMIDELTKKRAGAVGLNFTFTGLEAGDAASTQALADAMGRHGRVVVGSTLANGRLVRPNQALLDAGVRHGFLEKVVDDDFVIRRAFLSAQDSSEFSFPAALRKVDGLSVPEPERAQDERGEPIDYLFKANDLKTVSAWKLLDGHLGQEFVKGKTVLIGITSSLLSEEHRTPLGLMPGIVVHANEWVAMEEGRRLRELPGGLAGLIGWLVGAGLVLLFMQRRIWLDALAFCLSVFLIFLGAQVLFASDFHVPLFTLLAGPLLALATGVGANLVWLLLENHGLSHRVLHDKMTGLYTYDYLRMRLDDEWKRCQKMRLPVSVVMTDLDRFKKINDTLGHETGNQMILRAADVIRESARGYDVVSRYGGDEFVILLWHANRAEAVAYRDRLRALYTKMAQTLQEAMLKESSISIGIASFDPKAEGARPESPQQLVEWADKDLFEDKESRRKPGEARR